MPRAFGYKRPLDHKHLDKYPLTASIRDTITKPRAMVIGVNWSQPLDEPEQDSEGNWWVARDGELGMAYSGHCVCLKPHGAKYPRKRYKFYNQGKQGACVGYGSSQMMSFMNDGRLYDAKWLWDRAKERDDWPATEPGDNEGTSVRAAMEVLMELGHVPWKSGMGRGKHDHIARAKEKPDPAEGIEEFRWATSTDDVLRVLGCPELDYVVILNSWGEEYPAEVRMPATVLDELRQQDGEVAVVVDRQ